MAHPHLYHVIAWTFEGADEEGRPSFLLDHLYFAMTRPEAKAMAIADIQNENPDYTAGQLRVSVEEILPFGG